MAREGNSKARHTRFKGLEKGAWTLLVTMAFRNFQGLVNKQQLENPYTCLLQQRNSSQLRYKIPVRYGRQKFKLFSPVSVMLILIYALLLSQASFKIEELLRSIDVTDYLRQK